MDTAPGRFSRSIGCGGKSSLPSNRRNLCCTSTGSQPGPSADREVGSTPTSSWPCCVTTSARTSWTLPPEDLLDAAYVPSLWAVQKTVLMVLLGIVIGWHRHRPTLCGQHRRPKPPGSSAPRQRAAKAQTSHPISRPGSILAPMGVSPPRAPRTVRDTLASYGSRSSAIPMQKPPMRKKMRVGADDPRQPVSCTFGPLMQSLELVARPADQEGIDPMQSRGQLRLVAG